MTGSPAHLPVWKCLKPLGRVIYELHYLGVELLRRLLTIMYREPLMRGRASRKSGRFFVGGLPVIEGQAEINLADGSSIGELVRIRGKGRLILLAGSGIGDDSEVVVESEVIIEEQAIVSTQCRISDADSWPGGKQGPQPIHIGRGAWIANGVHILKGVTIGEGAIIGTNSVVTTNIPPFALAMGNPAQVYFQRPSPKQ